jgi:hypothetical protein
MASGPSILDDETPGRLGSNNQGGTDAASSVVR